MKSSDEADKVQLAEVVSSEKAQGPKPGQLVPQKHGGALRYGSPSGNPGNMGAPPARLVEVARLEFAKRIPGLCAIFDDESNRPNERVGALRLLGDTGQVSRIVIDLIDARPVGMTLEQQWSALKRAKSIEHLEDILRKHAEKQLKGE